MGEREAAAASSLHAGPSRAPVRLVVLAVAVLLVGLVVAVSTEAKPDVPSPNIVVFVTDDEPALDRRFLDLMPNARLLFKKQGVVFTDFHAATNVCCPTRATLLSGLRSQHHGVFNNGRAREFDPSTTLATVLQEIGYHTILVGKYLNGWGEWGAPYAISRADGDDRSVVSESALPDAGTRSEFGRHAGGPVAGRGLQQVPRPPDKRALHADQEEGRRADPASDVSNERQRRRHA